MPARNHYLAALACLLSLWACGSDSTPADDVRDSVGSSWPHTVEAANGAARLVIPEGALPADVDVSAVSITRVPEGEYPVSDSAEEVLGAYRLEPGGTVFSSPVTIQLDIDQPVSDHTWIAFLVSDDEAPSVDFVPITDAALNEAADRFTGLEAELTHFSTFVVNESDSMIEELSFVTPPPSTTPKGGTFEVSAQFVLNSTGNRQIPASPDYEFPRFISWKDPEWTVGSVFSYSPILVKESKSQAFFDEATVRQSATFTCQDIGYFGVSYLVKVVIPFDAHTIVHADGTVTSGEKNVVSSSRIEGFGECVAAEAGCTANSCPSGFRCEAEGCIQCRADGVGKTNHEGLSSECDKSEPYCTAGFRCAVCLEDAHCEGTEGRPFCDGENQCAECRVGHAAEDCTTDPCRPYCDGSPGFGNGGFYAGRCVACETDEHCPSDARPRCNELGSCVACVESADCSGGNGLDKCFEGYCTDCESNDDCNGLAGPLCSRSGCRDCDFSSCADDYSCVSGDVCSMACAADSECGEGFICLDSNGFWNTTKHCAECRTSDDCKGARRPVCDDFGFCIGCDTDNPCAGGQVCTKDRCVACTQDVHCLLPGAANCGRLNVCDGCDSNDDCLAAGRWEDGIDRLCDSAGVCQLP